MNIGILYICTGKYSVFWEEFYETAEKHLFPKQKKNYFVFTDLTNLKYEGEKNVCKNIIPHREWPYNTLMRFHYFEEKKSLYKNCDYLFFYNANTIFKKDIFPHELLPTEQYDFVALCNNDVYKMKNPNDFTYDRNPKSTAYIPFGEGSKYYRGGFNGGKTSNFLDLITYCKHNIEVDFLNNIIALWHDESHLNRYLLDKSVLSVNSLYGKAEEWKKPNEAKVIFLDKNRIFGSSTMNEFKKNIKQRYSLKRFFKKLTSKLYHIIRGMCLS